MRHIIFSASCLAALRPGHDYRPALDEIAALGFSAARVFAGRLTWCGQEPGPACDRLPQFLTDAHARGLNGHVVALTDTRDGDREAYPRREHAARVAQAVTPFDIVEWANEPTHPSQYDLTSTFLRSLQAPSGVAVAMGAANDDEDAAGFIDGAWVTRHLDRGRDEWNMVRRVKELMVVSEQTDKPIMSGEPIGSGEQDEPGKRLTNPSIFYTMAALGQLFGVSTCFHSSDGLLAQPLGPQQRRCAEAFIAGSRSIPAARYTYKNAGHQDSPVRGARFNDGDLSKEGCTRAYSGLQGDTGFSVVLGVAGNSGVDWAWQRERIGGMPGVEIYRVAR